MTAGKIGMLDVTVYGVPKPKGSKNVFRAGNRLIATEKPSVKAWQQLVSLRLQECWEGPLFDGPVRVTMTFYFVKPKSNKDVYPQRKNLGDLDKLVRAVGDALTGIVLTDDSRIVSLSASKRWGERPGVTIVVSEEVIEFEMFTD